MTKTKRPGIKPIWPWLTAMLAAILIPLGAMALPGTTEGTAAYNGPAYPGVGLTCSDWAGSSKPHVHMKVYFDKAQYVEVKWTAWWPNTYYYNLSAPYTGWVDVDTNDGHVNGWPTGNTNETDFRAYAYTPGATFAKVSFAVAPYCGT